MKIEKQITSLKLSKKLKELGVKQESYWYWVKHDENDPKYPDKNDTNFELLLAEQGIDSDDEGREWTVKSEALKNNSEFWEVYSAFSVAELGEILPSWVKVENKIYFLEITKLEEDGWEINYLVPFNNRGFGGIVSAKLEANARAKMLIYLIEKRRIAPDGGKPVTKPDYKGDYEFSERED